MNHFISGIIKIVVLEASIALLLIDLLAGNRFERARRFAFALLAGFMVFAWMNYGSLRGASSWPYTMAAFPVVLLISWLFSAAFADKEQASARQLAFRDTSREFADETWFAKLKNPHRLFAPALALVLGGGWIWWGVTTESTPLVHQWEQFHFYLGAKYQKEVGWFDLYKAALLADREGPRVMTNVPLTRNLETFDDLPVEKAMEDSARVRAQFSDEQWANFKQDWLRLARSWSPAMFEAEALTSEETAAEVRDIEGASGGKARTLPKTAPAGLVFRLTRQDHGLLALGTATASVRLSVAQPAERIATLRCFALRRDTLVDVGRTVAVETKDWKAGEWRNVDVSCDWQPSDEDQYVELADFVPAKTDLSIDSIRLQPEGSIDWGRIVGDHGNSNSPAWSIIAHPISRLVTLTPKHQVYLGWIDMVLMLGMWLLIYETFGRKVASVGLLMWAAPPLVFDYLSGSFLRWDWLFCLGMAACFIHRQKWATAGGFFGFAVATKLFPLFFGVGLLMRAFSDFQKTGAVAMKKEYTRFAVATGAVGLACVVISTAMFGLDAWPKYAKRIEVAQNEKFYAIQYSLKTVYLQTVAPGDSIVSDGIFPRALKQDDRNVHIEDYSRGFLAVRVLFTLFIFFLARRATPLEAFLLGPLLVFTWLTVNMYYWNMLGLLAMGLAMRKQRAAVGMLVGLHVIFMVFYLYQHMNRGFSEGYAVAVLMCLWIIAGGLYEVFDASKAEEAAASATEKPAQPA